MQLGRPLTLSLRHLGRRVTQLEPLVMTFSALLLAGDIGEARATGAELYELAARLDASKLYTALDAMGFLAGQEGRYDAAARIARCADIAHEAHGQARRRPAEERMRIAAAKALDEPLGPGWRAVPEDCREQFDEAAACARAHGLCT